MVFMLDVVYPSRSCLFKSVSWMSLLDTLMRLCYHGFHAKVSYGDQRFNPCYSIEA